MYHIPLETLHLLFENNIPFAFISVQIFYILHEKDDTKKMNEDHSVAIVWFW